MRLERGGSGMLNLTVKSSVPLSILGRGIEEEGSAPLLDAPLASHGRAIILAKRHGNE